MERSALYRRALAPIMTFAGVVGISAAGLGVFLRVEAETTFISYWVLVAIIGVAGAFLLVRRQALKSAETFWSPPTRRVAQALLPALTAGFLLAVWQFVMSWQQTHLYGSMSDSDDASQLCWLPGVWAIFYGCALHAAGFFTSRGLRLFGWMLIVAGNVVLFLTLIASINNDASSLSWENSHWLMGFLFGLLQLAYGIYLYFTEKRRNES